MVILQKFLSASTENSEGHFEWGVERASVNVSEYIEKALSVRHR
jgi:hypothetical protein